MVNCYLFSTLAFIKYHAHPDKKSGAQEERLPAYQRGLL